MIKKRMVFMLLFVAMALSVFPHGIKVSQPDGKTKLTIGKSYSIEWILTRGKAETVQIELYDPIKKKRLVIEEKVKNSGKYDWAISKETRPGTYKILILVTDQKDLHGVSKAFEIQQGK